MLTRMQKEAVCGAKPPGILKNKTANGRLAIAVFFKEHSGRGFLYFSFPQRLAITNEQDGGAYDQMP